MARPVKEWCALTGRDYKTYCAWRAMRQRCRNPNHSASEHYRGRGISIDPSWDVFDVFAADMGPRPEGMSLDRIDNDRGYSRDNCRWATWKEQERNRRNTKVTESMAAEIRGRFCQVSKRVTNIKALAVEFGLSTGHVWNIIRGARWA